MNKFTFGALWFSVGFIVGLITISLLLLAGILFKIFIYPKIV